MRTSGVVASLAEQSGASKAAVREDLWPNLLAVHDETLGGDPEDFSLAMHLDLSGEDHLSLHGIPKSRREAKKILAAFDESLPSDEWEEIPQPTQQIEENNTESTKEESDDSTQFFRFILNQRVPFRLPLIGWVFLCLYYPFF